MQNPHFEFDYRRDNIDDFIDRFQKILSSKENKICLIQVYGIVQGVGFRPFVYGVANRLMLKGFVRNMAHCVEIILDSKNIENICEFLKILICACNNSCDISSDLIDGLFLPHNACIYRIEISLKESDFTYFKQDNFYIEMARDSNIKSKGNIKLQLPLDMGICASCLKDLNDTESRFYNYAFCACINCGARYSIIESMPYNRENTSMAWLEKCTHCHSDYSNSDNKRFHTEIISCNDCAIEMEYYEILLCESKNSINTLPIGWAAGFREQIDSINKPNQPLQGKAKACTTKSSLRESEATKACSTKGTNPHLQIYNKTQSSIITSSLRGSGNSHNEAIYKQQSIRQMDCNSYAYNDKIDSINTQKTNTHHEKIKASNKIKNRFHKIAHNENAIKSLANALQENTIAIYKGLSGFAYIANARNAQVLKLLREIKMRPNKPFVIVANQSCIKSLAVLNDNALNILNSQEAPIIITLKNTGYNLSDEVTSLNTIGVMKPYSPALIMLFKYLPDDFALVYTSANAKGDMISKSLDEIPLDFVIDKIKNFQGIESSVKLAVLDYKRDIIRALDDSIMLGFDLFDESLDSKRFNGLRAVRLSRGFAPFYINTTLNIKALSVGFGAMQKSSIAFGFRDDIVISPYLGDLWSVKNCLNFKQNFAFLESIYGMPEIFITDFHAQYESTKIAHEIAAKYNEIGRSVRVEKVQHHHAHLNALLIEKGAREGLGVIFDGSGLGNDKSIWGGEFLYGNLKSVERKLFFKPFRILGGEKNIKDCKKLLLGYALENNLNDVISYLQDVFKPHEFSMLNMLFNNKASSPYTSSVGRLFDIASFFLGLDSIGYEGQSGELIASLVLDIAMLDSINQRNLSFIGGKTPPLSSQGIANEVIYTNKSLQKGRATHATSSLRGSKSTEAIHTNQSLQNNKALTHKAYLLKSIKFNPYRYEIGIHGIDISPCISDMLRDMLNGIESSLIALRFIDTLAFCVRDSILLLGEKEVLFGGGVFANYVLCARIKQALAPFNIKCFFPAIPCNDYSISLGQLGYASCL